MSVQNILEELKRQEECILCKLEEKDIERIVEESDDIGFDDLPKGWDRESLLKFARSLTGKTQDDTEGFWTECFDRLKDEEGFDEESAKKFCAALKDEYLQTTDWRGEDDEED